MEQYEQRQAALAGQRAAEQEQEVKREAAAAQRKARADERRAAKAAEGRAAAVATAIGMSGWSLQRRPGCGRGGGERVWGVV